MADSFPTWTELENDPDVKNAPPEKVAKLKQEWLIGFRENELKNGRPFSDSAIITDPDIQKFLGNVDTKPMLLRMAEWREQKPGPGLELNRAQATPEATFAANVVGAEQRFKPAVDAALAGQLSGASPEVQLAQLNNARAMFGLPATNDLRLVPNKVGVAEAVTRPWSKAAYDVVNLGRHMNDVADGLFSGGTPDLRTKIATGKATEKDLSIAYEQFKRKSEELKKAGSTTAALAGGFSEMGATVAKWAGASAGGPWTAVAAISLTDAMASISRQSDAGELDPQEYKKRLAIETTQNLVANGLMLGGAQVMGKLGKSHLDEIAKSGLASGKGQELYTKVYEGLGAMAGAQVGRVAEAATGGRESAKPTLEEIAGDVAAGGLPVAHGLMQKGAASIRATRELAQERVLTNQRMAGNALTAAEKEAQVRKLAASSEGGQVNTNARIEARVAEEDLAQQMAIDKASVRANYSNKTASPQETSAGPVSDTNQAFTEVQRAHLDAVITDFSKRFTPDQAPTSGTLQQKYEAILASKPQAKPALDAALELALSGFDDRQLAKRLGETVTLPRPEPATAPATMPDAQSQMAREGQKALGESLQEGAQAATKEKIAKEIEQAGLIKVITKAGEPPPAPPPVEPRKPGAPYEISFPGDPKPVAKAPEPTTTDVAPETQKAWLADMAGEGQATPTKETKAFRKKLGEEAAKRGASPGPLPKVMSQLEQLGVLNEVFDAAVSTEIKAKGDSAVVQSLEKTHLRLQEKPLALGENPWTAPKPEARSPLTLKEKKAPLNLAEPRKPSAREPVPNPVPAERLRTGTYEIGADGRIRVKPPASLEGERPNAPGDVPSNAKPVPSEGNGTSGGQAQGGGNLQQQTSKEFQAPEAVKQAQSQGQEVTPGAVLTGRLKEKYAQETPPGKGPGTFGYDHTTDPTARKVEQVEKARRTEEKAAAAEQRRIDEGMMDPGINARTLEKAQATVAQVGAKEVIRRANSGQGGLVDSLTDEAADSAMTLKTALDDLGKRAYDDPEAMPLLVKGMTTFYTALRNSGKFMQASQTRFKSEAQKIMSKAQDLLYTPSAEFREMRSQAGPAKQAQMDAQWLEESQRNAAKVKRMLQNDKGLKKYLEKKGVGTDMRSLLESDDPIVAAKVASAVSSARATNADRALQWMINWGMLGQLTTQSVNLVSTPAFFLYKSALLRPAEAALNSALSAVGKGSAENAQWGEFSRMAQQMGYGLKQALVNANTALLLGGSYKSRPRGDSIHAATYSKFPRMPSIFLAVMDELNTGLIRPMLAASHAYRTGKQLVAEGKLEASKLDEYVRREATTEGSDADIQGLLEARHISANEEAGAFSKWVQKGTNFVPGGKLLNPFQHTAGNLTKMAYKYSPLSTPTTILKLAASGEYRRSPKALEEASAMLMSWGATAVAAQLLASDSITGTYTGYSKTAERQFENGIVPPYHVKIGDRWWNYGRVDPVSKILGLGVDVTKAYKAGKAEQANKTWRTLISAAYSPVRDNSAFTGFKFLMDMIEQPERTAELLTGKLQDIALLAIPSFTRNSLNNFDEKQRESRNYEKTLTHEWFQEQFGRITAEKMGAKLGMPKVDVFGNFIFKDEAPGQSGAFHNFLSGLERSVLPIGASIPDKKVDRAADWFRKYNASVDYPDSYWPQPLSPEYVDNTGKKSRMSPEQLVHARILAGREFHTQMMALTANGNPSVQDVRASHENANAYGRAVALQKYPKPE